MQLMATRGLEHETTAGLDWISGDVRAVLPDDPLRIADAVSNADRLARTVVVLTGGDDQLRAAYQDAHRAAGRTDAEASRHFVVVGPAADGLVSLAADPHAPGPWGALSASALVPAALAGVDVAELLDQAEMLAPALASDSDNPALALGIALGTAPAWKDSASGRPSCSAAWSGWSWTVPPTSPPRTAGRCCPASCPAARNGPTSR